MTALPALPSRIAVAALVGLSLAAPLHAAAPRVDGKRVITARRAASPRPRFDFVPGQPTRFPRELLPQLFREFESEIEEPGEETPEEPRRLAGLEHASRPVVGTNRLINDPAGDPPASTQSENAFAAHGRYLVAGWNESFDPGEPRSFSGYGYSSDGGKTWKDGGTLPHGLPTDFTVGDPCLTVDEDGNFYYASLYSPDGEVLGVSVSRGRFRGSSFAFGKPVMAGVPGDDAGLDKEWIAADPENGNLYVTFTRFFEDGSSQIELVRSQDHGRTWTKPLVLTDPTVESTQGSRPVVGPDHEVYVVYSTIDVADFSMHMRIRKSTNQGKRFGNAVNIGEGKRDVGGIFLNIVTGPPGFNRPGGVEFPSIAVDRSKGDDRGSVYVTWPEAVDYFDDALGDAGVTAESEGNDTPDVGTPFTLGTTLVGSFATSTDADWFSFSGRKGQTVEFFLTPSPGGASDGFIRLFCRDGATGDRLAFSYFGEGQGFITFTLPSNGTYLLRALPINPDADGGSYFVFTGTHQPNAKDLARDARDVVLARSDDGIHWKRRARVNHDPAGYDNSFSEVAVDEGGDVHVIWYDHRNDAKFGILSDVYASRSRDGGQQFESDQRVNDGPGTNWNLTPSRLAPNMGDYISLVADGKNVYANWADGRLGSPDSWMAVIGGFRRDNDDDSATPATDGVVVATGRIALSVPNPARLGSPIAVSFELPRAGAAQLGIYSVTGQRVRTLLDGAMPAGAQRLVWDARGRDGASVPPGVYFVMLTTLEAKLTRRIVLLQ